MVNISGKPDYITTYMLIWGKKAVGPGVLQTFSTCAVKS